MLDEAIAFAADAHAGQSDKAGEPYILHPLRVMLRLSNPQARIAAVLHDVVEDCDVELAYLKDRFGGPIADAVDALSKRSGETYAGFIARCRRNEVARLVKVADLLDNLDPIRLERLPIKDQERLVAKYRVAAKQLGAAIAGV